MTLEVREILLATDFSDVARLAARTAAELARHFGARLHVLHVMAPGLDPGPRPRALEDTVSEVGADLRVVSSTTTGSPSREIVAYAARHAIDLIVIGTHGRTGVSRVLLGSVAEAVVRRAGCRVLTVPAGFEAPALVATTPAGERCVVCAQVSDELICASCRALIRGESWERKRADERSGGGASRASALRGLDYEPAHTQPL